MKTPKNEQSHDTARRNFLKTLGIGAAGVATGCGSGGENTVPGTDSRPNIIIIMADDMGYSDIGCYGGEVMTPNIDALATGGVRFTQFYNTARCCPTRASLLTGLYQHQAGIGHMWQDTGFEAYTGDLNEHSVTIAEVMKSAGYATYMSGKWHVTKHVGHWNGDEQHTSNYNWPRQRGFDRFFGTITGCGSFYDPITLVEENEPAGPVGDDFFYTDAITDHAIDFLTGHAGTQADKPFFLYLPYTAPHWPLHAHPEDIAKYEGRYDAGWDEIRRERYERMIEMGLVNAEWTLTDRDEQVPAWEDADDKGWEVRRMETYAAMIDRMDQGIGRLVASLKQNGQFENTLILFLADNGGCAEELTPEWQGFYIPDETHDGRPVTRGNLPELMPGPEETYQSYGIPWANASNTPFRLYKHWVHEGGISTPLIAHWPRGIEGGGNFRHQPGHLIDLMATCVDLGGAAYPATRDGEDVHTMEGVSLAPAFDDGPLPDRAIYWEHEGNRAVRKGKWKLVSKFPGEWELYDLEADRTELNNLVSANPEKAAELKALWDAWAERVLVEDWNAVQEGRRSQ